MHSEFENAQKLGSEKYARSVSKRLEYGTAGFRDNAKVLPHVTYRMGLLAVLRSKAKQGSTVGLMITASHNPEEDNGIKLCDPHGEMLSSDWELFATQLVNAKDEELKDALSHILASNSIDFKLPATVYLAHDTRSSSPYLSEAALDGIKVLNGLAKNFGFLTTPQLHFVVCCKNVASYGEPTAEGYYKKLSKAFSALTSSKQLKYTKYDQQLYVDGANGVGACKLKDLSAFISTLSPKIFNDGSNGVLNYKCGADYVKIEQKPPEGMEIENGKRYASFDGDADRLIYFYKDEKSVFHMLDGDKIATLFSKYIKDLIQQTRLNLDIRIVQTAYANGRSTDYIENTLKIPATCVPTGVKHLHHEAKKYDIGVYFEANGHGTVVFSDRAKTQIKALATDDKADDIQKRSAESLLNVINLINETVGDAISDLLLVEAILCNLDWNIAEWDSLYTDYPCRQLKVKVPNRQDVSVTNAGRTCVRPAGLQEAIDSAVAQYEKSRAFVRPSGTEDIVRVYAEADTQEHTDALAEEVSRLLKKFLDVQ